MSKSWTEDEIRKASEYMKSCGHMSYEEFCEWLDGYTTKREYYWNYLEELRRSGITNMFGATPYLMEEFGLEEKEARDILTDWMKNYDPDDYKDL